MYGNFSFISVGPNEQVCRDMWNESINFHLCCTYKLPRFFHNFFITKDSEIVRACNECFAFENIIFRNHWKMVIVQGILFKPCEALLFKPSIVVNRFLANAPILCSNFILPFNTGKYWTKWWQWCKMGSITICYQPISGQCPHFIPPENTRKPLAFWCFQGELN